MRNIVIVECISTGINYIEDIINRGHNPVVLEPKRIDTEVGREYQKMVEKGWYQVQPVEVTKVKQVYDKFTCQM